MKCEIAMSHGGASPAMLAWQHTRIVLPQRGTARAGVPLGPCWLFSRNCFTNVVQSIWFQSYTSSDK